jgi:hypothetical protein
VDRWAEGWIKGVCVCLLLEDLVQSCVRGEGGDIGGHVGGCIGLTLL